MTNNTTMTNVYILSHASCRGFSWCDEHRRSYQNKVPYDAVEVRNSRLDELRFGSSEHGLHLDTENLQLSIRWDNITVSQPKNHQVDKEPKLFALRYLSSREICLSIRSCRWKLEMMNTSPLLSMSSSSDGDDRSLVILRISQREPELSDPARPPSSMQPISPGLPSKLRRRRRQLLPEAAPITGARRHRRADVEAQEESRLLFTALLRRLGTGPLSMFIIEERSFSE
ncbi:hypothetical protein NL676_034627 [Syzygium grande]|nr:hypothetical protein NL676_034627 [Syzygium grande]